MNNCIDVSQGSYAIECVIPHNESVEYFVQGIADSLATISLSLTLYEQASCTISVRATAIGSGELKLAITIIHVGDKSRSFVDCRTVARDAAHISYVGRIIIPKTIGVDAAQYARILLVGDRSWGRAEPIIEVEAQDVACKHGSAVAPAPREEILFLRSRGLNEVAARELFVQSFLMA